MHLWFRRGGGRFAALDSAVPALKSGALTSTPHALQALLNHAPVGPFSCVEKADCPPSCAPAVECLLVAVYILQNRREFPCLVRCRVRVTSHPAAHQKRG